MAPPMHYLAPPLHSFSPWSLYASLYALLTVNLPFLLSTHITLSLVPVALKGMPRITFAYSGRKHWLTRSLFYSLLNKITNPLNLSLCSLRRNNLICTRTWDPFVFPNLDLFTISHLPPHSTSHQWLGCHDAPPCI